MRRLALSAAFAGLLALTGCGGVKAGDLFVVYRSGSAPHASLSLLVNEEGNVNCNGGPTLKISDSQLVKARTIQEETHDAAAAGTVLAPRPGSVFRYHLREEAGTVTFSDNSADQLPIFHQLQLFVLQTAQQVCHQPE